METPSQPEDRKNQLENKERDRTVRNLGLFAVILSDLVGYTGAGIAVGYFVWSKWGAPWWILLLTSLTGLSMAFYKMYKLSMKD
jgi:F0F1-type ATP synthase assembly protein I